MNDRGTARTVLVTGAGRGIGRSTALGLGRLGWNVLALDVGCSADGTGTDATPAEQAAAEIEATGGRALASAADITSPDAVRSALDAAVDRWGSVDAVVNVAGVLRLGDISTMSDEDWSLVIDVNLSGTLNVNRIVSRHWAERGARFGRIVNFTSAAGLEGQPDMLAYSTAKAGLIGMTLSLANSMPASGFTANVIAPLAATRMAAAGMGVEGSDEQLDEAARVQLAGLDLDPDAVVPLVAFLLSDAAEVMTGQVFTNRGWSYCLLSHPEPLEQVDAGSRELFAALADLQAGFGGITPAASRWGARTRP